MGTSSLRREAQLRRASGKDDVDIIGLDPRLDEETRLRRQKFEQQVARLDDAANRIDIELDDDSSESGKRLSDWKPVNRR